MSEALSMLRTIILITGLLGVLLQGGWAATTSMDEKPALPDDLYFELKAVPADQNAIIQWRQAAAVEVSLSDKQKITIKYCTTPGAREPSADDLDGLQAWLKRNREALEIFDASLQKAKAQWPERNPQNKEPEMLALSVMIRARLFAADQLAEQNKFADAVRSLEGSLKLTQMGVDGDPALINYSIACSMRTATQDAIMRLACRKQVPVPLLKQLLTNLPSLTMETNIYDHVLRAEFTRDYNNHFDLKRLIGDWSKMMATNSAVLSFYPDELQRAFRILLDPALVPLHPKPLDLSADIERNIRNYRLYRENSFVPWTERDSEVELENENDRTNLVHDVAPLMKLLRDDSLPLSRAAAQKARAAYVQIENPIGRIFNTSILGFMISDLKVCQVRTEREAARAFLALIIFERQKGRLPATLSDLVQEKILEVVPLDPFCGKPLNYSRDQRKIWSVSNDGVDDNGESGQLRWYEKDAVWQIPELN